MTSASAAGTRTECVRFAVSDLAEQDVVLHRGGGVIAIRVEKLDLGPARGRQIGAKYPPGLQQPGLHSLIDDIEPMPCRDQLEGQ